MATIIHALVILSQAVAVVGAAVAGGIILMSFAETLDHLVRSKHDDTKRPK
jgi:hypothetical protein